MEWDLPISFAPWNGMWICQWVLQFRMEWEFGINNLPKKLPQTFGFITIFACFGEVILAGTFCLFKLYFLYTCPVLDSVVPRTKGLLGSWP